MKEFTHVPVIEQGMLWNEREEARKLIVPWAMIAAHEAQALRNHGQSLHRLCERGGLAPHEMIMILEGRGLQDYPQMTNMEAIALVQQKVDAWHKAQSSPK